MIIASPSLSDAIMHFLLITWKIFFALIPPVKTGGGFPAFFIALGLVGAITAIVGDVAELLGCVLSIPPAITAITLVALGTSVPDTFASVTAAQGSEYADSAVGNVTGSNSVNIFLGLGLPWVICAQYGLSIDQPYEVPAGKLGFTVFIFLICSVITFVILTARRVFVGGELGGPMKSKVLSGVICFILWFVYVILSVLDSLGIIN
jgi:solute carrier family 8 (sodium/calcium exchanger)|tara:strand:- start:115 stop:732 length:618 start_codon:yes stop_codon:yes gene_type:complete